MNTTTDWSALWTELVLRQKAYWDTKHEDKTANDIWQHKARDFDAHVEKRWSRPDSSRECMLAMMANHPGATFLDIGAGTGAWALLLAPHVAKVTALEPSDAMAGILTEKLARQGIGNVEIVKDRWPEAQVEPHDFTLASHSLYGCEDFRRCVERMIAVTRKTCFLLLRLSLPDALIAKAATRVWCQPHDSPNFQIAYNALLEMGICADVRIEAEYWDPWLHDSLDAAVQEVKARLGITADNTHDAFLTELLDQSLVRENGKLRWPAGIRSALVYWQVA